ncbi:ATPase AAA domain-containing protein 3 [Bulinus truncatus]|nr:ATPase AAA domain-containing protein 3 [Bulinus truncatus]
MIEHAKEALLLIQEQERVKALETQKQIKEYEAHLEQLKLEQVRAVAEERRKTMAEETKQHQYKAQYDDQLARKRYEDQLAQQARMNEENLRRQEESVKKQEALRIATLEKEAEIGHKHDLMRIEAEMRGRAQVERENRDIIKEQIKLRAEEDRKTKLEASGDVGPMGKEGVTAMHKVFDWVHTSSKGLKFNNFVHPLANCQLRITWTVFSCIDYMGRPSPEKTTRTEDT